jgi:oligoribonuclease NrnB/cAMP/cGMP phosphodiesterase (DHH superfamily)
MLKMLDKTNIDCVLYHDNCADGFGSAFCVWLKYCKEYGNPIKIESDNTDELIYKFDNNSKIVSFIGCKHNKDTDVLSTWLSEKITDKNVLMCDFSYKFEILSEIIDKSKSFMILDHHESAQKDLQDIPNELKIFDMKRSGVGITWEYLFNDEEMPKFLQYIQDRDIWAYKLPETKAFAAYLFEQKFSFELFESYLVDDNLSLAVQIGQQWLEYKDILVNSTAKRAYQYIQKIHDKLMIVSYTENDLFVSDVGNKIFTYFPLSDFSAVYNHNAFDYCTKFSLRSTDDRENVSVIAKEYDGGGHRNASGCTIPSKIVISLPYKIYDNKILQIFKYAEYGPLVNDDSDLHRYILFKVKTFNDDWLKNDYVHLMKRKFPNSKYFVFNIDNTSYKIISNNVDIKLQLSWSATTKSVDEIFNEFLL